MVRSPCRNCLNKFPECFKTCKILDEVQRFSVHKKKDIFDYDTGADSIDEHNVSDVD